MDNSTPTRAEVNTALNVVTAIGEAIRDLGTVPSGHVYASVMGTLTLDQYESCINILVRTGLVRRDPLHHLTWIGGQ